MEAKVSISDINKLLLAKASATHVCDVTALSGLQFTLVNIVIMISTT